MVRHISADFVIPVIGEPLKNGVISVNGRGEILKLYDSENSGLITETIERFEGIIVPGLVNSHCHLELSHLAGDIEVGKGLIPFIAAVMAQRPVNEQTIIQAMELADKAMHENGIVAVGDISNNSLSKNIKKSSSIHYHTFVEFLGFDPKNAKSVFDKAVQVLEDFAPMHASLAPHAPYSVSRDLLKLFQKNSSGDHELTSMHNQESEDENDLYRYKTGRFIEFYRNLNLNIDLFRPQARNSIQSVLPLFSKKQRILLVHNTFTSLKDIHFAKRFNRDIHWCFCPGANLYIEKRLPKIEMFSSYDFNITLGTDSLASNDKLCILSELKTLKEHFPLLPFTETIRWATINGAVFLGIDQKYGSIEKGKTPGLNLITHTNGLELTAASIIKKLV